MRDPHSASNLYSWHVPNDASFVTIWRIVGTRRAFTTISGTLSTVMVSRCACPCPGQRIQTTRPCAAQEQRSETRLASYSRSWANRLSVALTAWTATEETASSPRVNARAGNSSIAPIPQAV